MKKLLRHLPVLFVIIAATILAVLLTEQFKTNIILASSVGVYKTIRTAVLATGVPIIAVYAVLLARKTAKTHLEITEQRKLEQKAHDELKANPAKKLAHDIEKYLDKSDSAGDLKNNLFDIAAELPEFETQITGIKEIVTSRFGEDSLTYDKFINPIDSLYSNLISLLSEMLQKIKLFNENKYIRKIERLNLGNQDGKHDEEIAECNEVLKHYDDYVNEVIASFKATKFKLDRLVLEVSKLDINELQERSNKMLEELDEVISHTKLYK